MKSRALFVLLLPTALAAQDLPRELKNLEVFVGDWDVVERVWPEPGAKPIEIRQTSTARMILGGRFLQIRDRSLDGSYEFIGWHGYHTVKGRFINVAISTRRTDINPGECHFDDAARYQCVIPGLDEPVTGVKTATVRGIAVFEGRDKYTWMNIRDLPNGTEFRFREVVYTRRSPQ
jgi:hypothetical protein